MTREEAIEVFNKPAKHIGLYNGELTYSAELVRAFEMAIRSFEAWDKVLDELREYGAICVEYTAEDDKVDAIVDSVLKQAKQAVLEIINKHLNEIIISKHTEHSCCYWNNGCTIGNHPCTDNYDCEDFD